MKEEYIESLPWSLEIVYDKTYPIACTIYDDAKDVVASDAFAYANYSPSIGEAKLIIKAVNNHAALVDMVRELREKITYIQHRDSMWKDKETQQVVDKATQLLGDLNENTRI